MGVPRIFDKFRTGYSLRHVASALHIHGRVAGPVHDQRRHFDRSQDRANIDLGVHGFVGSDGGGTAGGSHVTPGMLDQILRGIRSHAGAGTSNIPLRRPVFLNVLDHLGVLLRIQSPWMIFRGEPSGHPSPSKERSRARGVGGGEYTGHGGALRNAQYHGRIKADRIHYCANVVTTLLECGHASRAIGEAGATFVEANEATDRTKLPKKIRSHGKLPIHIEMRKGAGRPNEVERTATADLIGDVDIAAFRVVSFRFHKSGRECAPLINNAPLSTLPAAELDFKETKRTPGGEAARAAYNKPFFCEYSGYARRRCCRLRKGERWVGRFFFNRMPSWSWTGLSLGA